MDMLTGHRLILQYLKGVGASEGGEELSLHYRSTTFRKQQGTVEHLIACVWEGRGCGGVNGCRVWKMTFESR